MHLRRLREPEEAKFFPWALQRLKRGELVIVAALNDLPPETAHDGESWQLYGTESESALVMPLSIERAFGALSFASLRQQGGWPEGLIKRIELFAEGSRQRDRPCPQRPEPQVC